MTNKKSVGRWLLIALVLAVFVSTHYVLDLQIVDQDATLSTVFEGPITAQEQETRLNTVVTERGNTLHEAIFVNSERSRKNTNHIRHAGRRLVVVSEDGNGHIYADCTGNIVMFFDRREVSRDLDKPFSITKGGALEKAKAFCGGAYTLKRITENPHDFDILMQRYVGDIEILTDDCYVGVNRHTGQFGVYRKLPLSDISGLSAQRLTVEKSLLLSEVEATNVAEVRQIYIPSQGLYWIIRPENSFQLIVVKDDLGSMVEPSSMRQIIKNLNRRVYE